MKKVLDALWRVLSHTSIAFTAILLFFWLFMDSGNNDKLYYEYITGFFKFALVFGVSSLVAYIPKMPAVLKIFVRFIINTVAFTAFVSVLGQGTQNARFVAIILFVAVYVVVTALAVILAKLSRVKVKEDVRAETTEE